MVGEAVAGLGSSGLGDGNDASYKIKKVESDIRREVKILGDQISSDKNSHKKMIEELKSDVSKLKEN